MLTICKEIIVFVLARLSAFRFVQVLGRAGLSLYKGVENYSYNSRLNGERFVLSRLNLGSKVVFDVGANRGNWAKQVIELHPKAEVHCFELVPKTFEMLSRSLIAPQVKLNNFGLADKSAWVEFFEGRDCDEHASLLPLANNQPSQGHLVEVQSGDRYVIDQGLKHIDYLKIDVEGAELTVLKGFDQMLAARKIDLIQFEYGPNTKQARVFLADFYDLLGKYGFILGKIFPNGVDFKEYHIENENFVGPNYIAVRSECTSLLKALSRKPGVIQPFSIDTSNRSAN
ncbi:MAG: FkbM family methyltransferase [Oligoflexus sp.]|jgi:FkbM family methyltransferase